jgi:precorrin-6A synthase
MSDVVLVAGVGSAAGAGGGMVDLWLVGIGTGNPDHVTLEARRALNEAALVMVPRKGPDKADLAELRHRILTGCGYCGLVVEFDMPLRDESLPYAEGVARWHDEIARAWVETMATAARCGAAPGPVALLVWGDPGLYDSTLRIAERLSPRPRIRVVPGISALQALSAAHAIPFATLGGAVTLTTGRRLRDHGWPVEAESVVVMLDGDCSFRTLDPDGISIWWGAYLGMPEEMLESGRLVEAGPRIVERRASARARHGWIMDTYLLRRALAP